MTAKSKYYLLFTICLLLLFASPEANAATIGRPMHNAGLVGYWPMDEGGGLTAFDRSGNGRNGTLNNMDASTDWVSGQHGGALDFDDSDDDIIIGTGDNYDCDTGCTFSAWVNTPDTGGTDTILGRFDFNQSLASFVTKVSCLVSRRTCACGTHTEAIAV